jgi:hypothetical protein
MISQICAQIPLVLLFPNPNGKKVPIPNGKNGKSKWEKWEIKMGKMFPYLFPSSMLPHKLHLILMEWAFPILILNL